LADFDCTMISDPYPHQREPVVSEWYLAGQLSPRDPAREFPIHAAVFSVGRKPDNALSIPSHSVSGYHAEFLQTEAGLLVRDLNSTNGTFVNGQRLEGEVQVHGGDLVQFATEVFRIGHSTRRNESRTVTNDSSDQALALVQFDRLINDGNAFPYYQPIVSLPDQTFIGYEVLGRSRLFGLQMPAQMFLAAGQLNMEAELSEVFRMRGVQVGVDFPNEINLFLNTHPKELGPSRLYTSLRMLREADPNRKLTLEIHEGAVANIETIRELSFVLNELNIQLAFDDFGVGEARLVELAEIRPDYLKFDMKLTNNIHAASAKRQELVALFARMLKELGINTLAEGIETKECHETICQMGFKFAQGYYYGRPEAISRYLPAAESELQN
jgi:EAL domain-containing protein (putative c-di-GMP-specific phosphodiesterase class I)